MTSVRHCELIFKFVFVNMCGNYNNMVAKLQMAARDSAS